MNFLEKIRSCFWQDDLGAPTQRENQHGVVNSKPESHSGIELKDDEEDDSEEVELNIQKLSEEMIEMMIPVMMMNKMFWYFLDDIMKAAKELNIEYSLIDNIAYCEGKAQDVGKFEALLEKVHKKTVRGKKKRNLYLRDDDDLNIKIMDWDERNFAIPLDFAREDVDVVLYKAKKKNLKYRFDHNMLNVSGNKSDLSLFSEWFEEFTKNKRKQKQKFKEFLESLKLETITEKIKNSSYNALQKQDILKKSSTLGINCIFDDKGNKRTLEISGRADKVRCFKSYLQAIDMFPKYLYSKYWDFSIEDAYAEIEVEPTSDEFKEIKSKVCRTLGSANLTKLKRIQNQGLMNNYLTTVCSEEDQKREERKLLFYGPEIQEPEKIFKYSKTGFDLSCASFKGKFGRGLYFPIKALSAHGSAYEPSPKTFQVLVADVFVGDALSASETNQNFQNNSLKGYDSLLNQNNFYVVYKNFQSYPLYLVEYTLQLGGGVQFVEQKARQYKDDDEFVEKKVRQYKNNYEFVDQKVRQYEDDYGEIEEAKHVDVRSIEKFECPVELSLQAWDALKMQIEILNLTLVESHGNTIRVFGNDTNIETFSQWLNEFFSGILMGENNFEDILEKKNEKIPHSMLYNIELEKIMRKATELEVDCLLSMDRMSLTGLPNNLESFKAYLHKISHQAKKYLFPKYWDFSIIEPYVEVEVGFGTEEFKEISKIFNYGFEDAQVSRLTRIQNYDLFNNYISTICSKTQVSPDKNLQRKLVFHGTKSTDPKSIFMNSEIGFDMKYAKATGVFGQGIYFSTNSAYSHGFAFTNRSGTFQMLIADVYTGRSMINRNETLLRNHLPEDHDSLFVDHANFFVLFQNFQSYPLYLVEYMAGGIVAKYSPMKQKHMTNILNGGHYCLVDFSQLPIEQEFTNTRNDEFIQGQQPDPVGLRRIKKEFKKTRNDEFIQGQQPDPAGLLRIEKEFKNTINDEFIQENFLIDKKAKAEWLVSFKGFRDTPYEGGLFKIKIIFPANYPMEPPLIKFLTPIYHPSINENGRICLGLLSQWFPVTDIRHVLLAISCLLHDPGMEDSLMADRMALFLRNSNKYMKIARDWTLKYAN